MSNPRLPNPKEFGNPDLQPGTTLDPGKVPLPSLLDPAIVRAARQIYRQFYEAHPDMAQRPLGIALNRYNYRGKLIFGKRPILLPEECFVPLEQVQSELY